MKRGASSPLPKRQRDELAALAKLTDAEIDTAGIPEVLDWSGAKRGLFYRPVKRQVTLRLDADILDWFRARAPGGKGYQTRMNRVLRRYVEARQSKN